MSTEDSLSAGAPLRPGMLIAGRYLLVERLGGGGMGEVFLAEDKRLDRPVALKRLLPHLMHRPDLVERSEREGRILARLDHPAINRVYDMIDAPDGGMFLILQYVHGHSFADELRAEGPLPWERVAEVGIQVCGALAVAHEAGVVHRDIKPANILVKSSDGSVHVADFGIARLSNTPASVVGAMIGTPDYWAPEQADGSEATASSDLYSLCCVLFEAACGRPPFVAERNAAVAATFLMHVTRPVPDPSDVIPDFPPAARAVLMTGLAKLPVDRYPSAMALAEALEASTEVATPPLPATSRAETPEPAVVALGETVESARAGMSSTVPGAASPPTDAEEAPRTEPMGGRDALTVASPTPRSAETVVSSAADPSVQRLAAGRRAALVGVAALVTIAAGVGVGLAAAPADTPPAPDPVVVPTRPASAGYLGFRAPADWRVGDAGGAGFDLRNAKRLVPPGADADQAVVVGSSPAIGSSLLPEKVSSRRRTTVRMGGLVGYRYTGLRAAGRPVTAFVSPTTGGVATVLCPALPGPGSASCESVVSTLALARGAAFPLGPGPEQAKALTKAVERADAALANAGDIAAAKTRAGQADAARAVANGLRAAADLVPGAGDASPAILPATARLRRSLNGLADAFASLASAADDGSDSAWDSARAGVASANRTLRAALSELREAGYAMR